MRGPPGRRICHATSMLKRTLTIAMIAFAVTGLPSRSSGQNVEGGPAPYDGDLQRLAEILGALHYLRGICGANDGQKWRNEMQALLDAETPSGERRNRLQVRFNRGYRGFQQTYRTCTPAADLVIRRYLDEGAKIAREITARYSN